MKFWQSVMVFVPTTGLFALFASWVKLDSTMGFLIGLAIGAIPFMFWDPNKDLLKNVYPKEPKDE